MAIYYTSQLWYLSNREIYAGYEYFQQINQYDYFANGNLVTSTSTTYPAETSETVLIWSRDTAHSNYDTYSVAFLPLSVSVQNFREVKQKTALAILPCFRIGG